jgi:hypothetical protein
MKSADFMSDLSYLIRMKRHSPFFTTYIEDMLDSNLDGLSFTRTIRSAWISQYANIGVT